jgi:hypothetical protein
MRHSTRVISWIKSLSTYWSYSRATAYVQKSAFHTSLHRSDSHEESRHSPRAERLVTSQATWLLASITHEFFSEAVQPLIHLYPRIITMSELPLLIQIHSRYQVFDASGQLPFSIVFGLCRKSPSDTDPRSITLETARSIFDVPYALTHGLLALYERDEHADRWVAMDQSRMGNVGPGESERIWVPSPVNRASSWRFNLTEYIYPIDVQGALASILEVGKTYRIKLGSQDLGVKKLTWSEEIQGDGTGATKLISSRVGGNGTATFQFVKGIVWPPKVEIRMRLCSMSPSSDRAFTDVDVNTALEVTAVNTGSETISVQTRDLQKILVPYGPMGPDVKDPNQPDQLTRIIHASPEQGLTSSLKVVDVATGEVVERPGQVCTGCKAPHDPRPKVDELVMLKPGAPVIRVIDIGLRVKWLKGGQYKIRMHPSGCRWWSGQLPKEDGEDERVPARLYKGWSIPLMLETEDEVQVRVKDGKVVTST